MLSLGVKEAIRKTLLVTGKPVGHFFAGLGACLTYHTITSDSAQNRIFNPNLPLMVHVKRFEEQIAYLARNYNCLPLDRAMEMLPAGRLPRRTALVTFDDGYKDNLELALPVLEKYGVPATVFVTSGFVDRLSGPWWHELEWILESLESINLSVRGQALHFTLRDGGEKLTAFRKINYLMMGLPPQGQQELLSSLRESAPETRKASELILDWEEVRQLDRHPLITIGCHSRHHLVLRKLSNELLRQEINDARLRLETMLGHPLKHFCYPFGSSRQVGWREFEAVRKAGFVSAFTTRWGNLHSHHGCQMLSLPRFDAGYHDTVASLEWKLNGMEALRHKAGRQWLRTRAVLRSARFRSRLRHLPGFAGP